MASTSSSGRSSLIDHTYEDIYFIISGHRESLRPEQTTHTLNARIDKLKRVWEPFDGPNDASRRAIDGSAVTLADGTSAKVDASTKTLALAISEHFSLDEVDAYILLRSFLYNYGIAGAPGVGTSKEEIVEWVIERITPFYYSERLYVARTLIALLKCQQTVNDPLCSSARKLLPQIIPEPSDFANKLVAEFRRKSQIPIPPKSSTNPRHASVWAKQNAREQLVLLELLFWLLWDYSSVTAPLALATFTAAYETEFGHKQTNATSLLDTEGTQLKRDIAALWVLLTVEVLNLEYLPETLQTLPERTDENGPLYAAPSALSKIHDLVTNHIAPGFVCTILAWALFIRSISKAGWRMGRGRPLSYVDFLKNIRSASEVALKKGEQEVAETLLTTCLSPEAGFFPFMTDLLQSPLLLTSVATRTGSSVTDPGDIAYRALLKGLIICIIDAEAVETMPDFEGLVDTWVSLFGGNEETPFCGNLCRQFWDADWRMSKDRRGLLDVARSRFPIQFRPLVRILRSLSGTMRLENTDPDIGETTTLGASAQDRLESAKYVHYYFAKLPTFAQVIPPSQRSGGDALYDRTGQTRDSGGAAYTNLRPLNLPGGSTVPAKTVGRLLSADNSNSNVVVAWQHEHSGWKLIVDILLNYVYRRQGRARGSRHSDHAYGRRGDVPTTLLVGEIGIEDEEEDLVVADGLELILSIVQDNAPLTELLVQSLEEGGPLVSHPARDVAPPDLVQLIFMILDDVLGRATSGRAPVPAALVAPCLGILTTLLSLPSYSNRVWLFLRSSSLLFGSERDASYTSPILTSERSSGNYPMTISLIRLVRTLVEESISRLVTTHADQPKLQNIKEEVLLRALHFVQNLVWVEHAGWRYAHLSERFEISRGVMELYARIIEARMIFTSVEQSAEEKQQRSHLASFVSGILLTHAAMPTITPLVHTIASARTVLQALSAARRITELQSYGRLLEKALRLTRLTLQLKNTTANIFTEHILLEQALCSDHATSSMLLRASRASVHDASSRANPVDVLMYLIGQRDLGLVIPVEATRVLTCLCATLSESTSPDARPSLLGFLTDAQATLAGIVRILKHPYDDLTLRNALWTFVTVSVQKQPPLAVFFVAGTFRVQPRSAKGAARVSDEDLSAIDPPSASKSASAVEAACSTLAGWKDLWESNPELLASVLGFLEVVWDRSLENLAILEPTKGDVQFWKHIAAIAREELGPAPDFFSTSERLLEDELHSDLHDAIQSHAYKTKVKAHALKILGSDIAVHFQTAKGSDAAKTPSSYNEIVSFFENEELFRDAVSETVASSYDSNLYDRLADTLSSFSPLSIPSLMHQEPIDQHLFGDDFMLSVKLLRAALRSSMASDSRTRSSADQAKLLVFSANQNMSLANAQLLLMRAWASLLGRVKAYLRSHTKARAVLLSTAALASQDIAKEKRSGDFMATIHGDRLILLLALLEATWFSDGDSSEQVGDFMSVLENVGDIVASESFPPGRSFLGLVSVPFHRSILLLVFFCAKKCQQLDSAGQIHAEHRLLMSKVFTSSLSLVIDALRLTFDTARTRLDLEVDKDMELLVAVFQQCTRKGLQSSSATWLTRCQETDVVNASLKLLCQTDLSGLSDLDLLRSCGRPLYAPQVLSFHMTLASIPFTAERLASEGVIAAYSNNSISLALSEGAVATTLPELPNERSPAHRAYCAILENTTGMISNLVNAQQLIDSHVIGFVQLYGQQMTKALAWTNDEPLSLPRLEELELTAELFYLIASGAITSSRNDTTSQPVLRAFTEVALPLVQQLNYALTHPKHLTGVLEPITANERLRLDQETGGNIPVTNLNDLLDSHKRPMIANAVLRLFALAASLFNTLSIIGWCETVLLSDPEEWPTKEAVVVPHSKVKMGEPASIGTLLEFGQCCLETLQHFTSMKGVIPPAPAPKPTSTEIRRDKTLTIRLALETVLVYAATQLVLWLSKHDLEQANEAVDADEVQLASVGPDGHGYGNRAESANGTRGRRMRRKSQTTLADRLRRGMTGEMTTDLQSLVSKSRAAIASSIDAAKAPESIDILLIVESFLEDRTSTST